MWVPKLCERVGSTNPNCSKGCLEIPSAPEASLPSLCCRLEAKFVEVLEQRNSASAGGSCFSELRRQSGDGRGAVNGDIGAGGLLPRVFLQVDSLAWSSYKCVQGNWELWEALKSAQRSLLTGKEREDFTARGQPYQEGRSGVCCLGYLDSLV